MFRKDLELLLKYPLIEVLKEANSILYQGIITIGGIKDVCVNIQKSVSTGELKLKTRFGAPIDEILLGITTLEIVDFLDQCKSVLEAYAAPQVAPNLTTHYRRLLYEYNEFTRFHLNIKTCELGDDLSKINIFTMDMGAREHFLEVNVDFRETRNIFRAAPPSLPERFLGEFIQNFNNISEIYGKFLEIINSLQEFFNIMDEIDGNCSVLDPEAPTRGHCHRRIWLGEHLSVVITIDPLNASAMPDLKFLGPERIIDHFRDSLNTKLTQWDEKEDFIKSLMELFEIREFPVKPDLDRLLLRDVGECSICFLLRYNDSLPEIICGNTSCANFYHNFCLYEWLSSINSKRVFNQIVGQCPNCEKEIACSLPEVTKLCF